MPEEIALSTHWCARVCHDLSYYNNDTKIIPDLIVCIWEYFGMYADYTRIHNFLLLNYKI